MRDTTGVNPAVDAQDLPASGVAHPAAALARVLETQLGRETAIGDDEEAEKRRRLRLLSRDSPSTQLLDRMFPV